jgi:hypothetical protein
MDTKLALVTTARHEIGAVLRAAQKRRPWHYALSGTPDWKNRRQLDKKHERQETSRIQQFEIGMVFATFGGYWCYDN